MSPKIDLTRCYCLHSPTVEVPGYGATRIWTCNYCRNDLVEEKNALVRENSELRARGNTDGSR